MSATAARSSNIVPPGALVGAAALISFAIAAAFVGRLTGTGAVTTPRGTVIESRDLRFEDGPDGAVLVRAPESGRIVDVIAPGTNAFVRTTLRGLARTRRQEGIGNGPPFRLSRLAGGRLTLEDPATRRVVSLEAFGRPNAGAFGAILDAATRSP